ncbi:MAG: hypothetical protein R3D61_09310 [Defluviimonas denitrificans]
MVLPRWGIVTTADAPVSLLIAHAAHHLAAGAGEVHLYLDSAPDPAEDLAPLQRLPGVRVTVADRAWWRGRGGGGRACTRCARPTTPPPRWPRPGWTTSSTSISTNTSGSGSRWPRNCRCCPRGIS